MSGILNTISSYLNIIIGIAVFILLFAFRSPISKGILSVLSKIIFAKHPEHRSGFKSSLKKPVSFFFVLLGAFIGVYINYQKPVVLNTFKLFSILIVCWCILNYVSENLNVILKTDKDSRFNGIAVKFISNILKFLTVCIAVVMVISELGYNINGLLTGLGVGGLAVSLAAQDSLKNLISGFFIMFDKPFDVGDLIETAEFKGIVEDITMRSTRIRTLEDSIVIVPNSKLSEANITNLSKFTKRLVEFKIGLLYSTPADTIKKCENDIHAYLESTEEVCKNNIRVYFSEFDDSSINIQIRFYINTADYNEYCRFMNDFNFEIKKIIENNGTDFAFPTQSIHIEKD